MFRHNIMTAGLLLHFLFNIIPPPLLSLLTVRDRVKTLQFSYSFSSLSWRKEQRINRTTGLSGRTCISPSKIKSM